VISIRVNNEPRKCDPNLSLECLLAFWGFESTQIAVAVNESFVPRSRYSDCHLENGDRVEVLAPVQGG
jgi:sulfur carrier protein